MTIKEAINRADTLAPNTISESVKAVWLSQLDCAIRKNIWKTEPSGLRGADQSQEPETVLLADDQHCELYIYWLLAQIALVLGKLPRYNNNIMLYRMALKEYAVAYKNGEISHE